VNLVSLNETDLRPHDSVVVNAERRTAGSVDSTVPRELWRWLVAAALVLTVVEWLVYCRRVYI